jgi:hypothetical protein
MVKLADGASGKMSDSAKVWPGQARPAVVLLCCLLFQVVSVVRLPHQVTPSHGRLQAIVLSGLFQAIVQANALVGLPGLPVSLCCAIVVIAEQAIAIRVSLRQQPCRNPFRSG